MKHLKLFESFGEENIIHDICKIYGIDNYTINEDDSIDVDGSVNLTSRDLTRLPLKFRKVSGNFLCDTNKLTSLEGSPISVGGHFDCSYNNLTSLEGSPKIINGLFSCEFNILASLKGCPESIGDSFYCHNNLLTSFESCPKSVGRDFICSQNKIVTFEHLPLSIGDEFYCLDNPIYQIWYLFHDYSKIELFNYYDIIQDGVIILDRLNVFLEEIGKKPVTEVEGYKCI